MLLASVDPAGTGMQNPLQPENAILGSNPHKVVVSLFLDIRGTHLHFWGFFWIYVKSCENPTELESYNDKSIIYFLQPKHVFS